MADLGGLSLAIEAGDRASAVRHTNEALQAGVAPQQILDAMTDAMGIIGRRFQDGDIFVPEMLIAARAMKEATAILEPVLVEAGIRPEHTAVIGTVEGDLHDIGKNLVGMMLKGAAISVVDLGVNVPAQRFVDAAREHDARLIGLSALLTTTMPNMRKVVEAIKASDLNTKVIIGGAPTTPEFAAQIGAAGSPPTPGLRSIWPSRCWRGDQMPGMFETYGRGGSEARKPETLAKLDRVRKTFAHEEADRVPITDFFWGQFRDRWRSELGLSPDADPYGSRRGPS